MEIKSVKERLESMGVMLSNLIGTLEYTKGTNNSDSIEAAYECAEQCNAINQEVIEILAGKCEDL